MTINRTGDTAYYEQLYQDHPDPWGYLYAGEQLKYRQSLQAARRWQPTPNRVLETACSLGYLTEQLVDYAPEIYAYDISATAVRQTQARCAALFGPEQLHLQVGDAANPDYPDSFFDVIFLQDVILEVQGATLRKQILQRALQMLTPDGILLLVDYQQPNNQSSYCQLVEREGGRIVEKLYFHDRHWYRLRNALKGIAGWSIAKAILRSEIIYRALSSLSSWRGPEGSKHFGLIVQRNL